MMAKSDLMGSISLETMIDPMDDARTEKAFLIAPESGRVGLPSCYHLPYSVVAKAVERFPDCFYGLAGIDPYEGMGGVRWIERAVRHDGFIVANGYPH
jgi:predicted TIM-barrel fold metal-dependent hydrolase